MDKIYYLWSEDICELQGMVATSNLVDKDRIWKILNDIYLNLYCDRDVRVILEDKQYDKRI